MRTNSLLCRVSLLGAVLGVLASPASAADHLLTVNAGNAGRPVYPTMFGTNVVYDNLTVAQWPTFLATFEALGMNALRYPGGTVTEESFDFRNSGGPNNDRISLTMFLQAVAERDLTPLLVVPTKRFRSNYTTTGAQYAKDFVRAVNIDHGVPGGDQFGTTQTVTLWELGNEYYADNDGGAPLTPTLYGKIANKFASAMKTIDASIIPAVQFHRSDLPATNTIASQLTSGAVDACLTHAYPTSTEAFPTIRQQIEDGSAAFGLDAMVTEWNMGSDFADGLVLANCLPLHFRMQVEAGITISTQWPLMWHNNSVSSALAQNTGQLRPPGQIFQWLSQCANNRRMVPTSTSSAAVDCVAFKDPTTHRLSILVMCGNANQSQVRLTINGFNNGDFDIDSVKCYTAAGGPGSETAHTPAVFRPISPTRNGNVLFFTANRESKCEVIRIDLSH